MRHKNRIVFFLCITLTTLLLVGCSVPFVNDNAADQPTEDKQVEKADNTKVPDITSKDGQEQEQEAAEVQVAEPDQEESVEKEVIKGPKLTVNLPTTMSTEYEQLKISGSTTPGCTVFINGQTVRLKSDGTFSSEIALSPGNNVVEVTAVDKNEYSTQVKRTVNFIAGKPTLSVFAPSESPSTNVIISGYTDPGCVVYLNSNKVKADNNGSFTGTVAIKNNGNNSVKITSINDYGVATDITKTIRGVPPKIQVAAPEMITNDKTTITGVADANTSIVMLVGGEQVMVNNNDGTFNISLDMEPGLNDITVMATNLFGTTEVPLVILYDDYGKE